MSGYSWTRSLAEDRVSRPTVDRTVQATVVLPVHESIPQEYRSRPLQDQLAGIGLKKA